MADFSVDELMKASGTKTKDFSVDELMSASSVDFPTDRVLSSPAVQDFSIEEMQKKYAEANPSNTQRVETLMAERPNLLNEAMDLGSNSGAMDFPAKLIGGLGQRYESFISTPGVGILQAAQGGIENVPANLAKIPGRMVQALTGERRQEFGDVYRQLGAPEKLAAAAGLVAGGYTSPENLVTRLPRTLGYRTMAETAGAIGRKNLPFMTEFVHNASTPLRNYIVESRADFAKGIKGNKNYYYGQEALKDATQDIADDITKKFREPADAAYDTAVEAGEKENLSPNAWVDLVTEAEKQASSGVMLEGERAILKDAVNKLNTLSDKGNIKVSSIMDLLKTMKKSPSVPVSTAGRDLSDILGNYYGYVKEANKKWHLMRSAEEAYERSGVKLDVFNGEELVNRGSSRLMSYFNDVGAVARDALEGRPAGSRDINMPPSLLDLYKDNKLDTSKVESALKGIKNVVAAKKFESYAPSKSAAVGRLIALPIGLGVTGMKLFGPLGAGIGAAVGGAAALPLSMPRATANMLRASYSDLTPRAAFLKELQTANPFTKAVDMGIARGLTGRNEQ